MAKRGKFEAVQVQRKSPVFAICTVVYAVIFLAATAFGWKVLWDFMGSYEQSRPKNTVLAYMDSLNSAQFYAQSGDFFGEVDASVQSDEECRQILQDAVDGKLRYVKDSENSSETRQRYVVMADRQPIGNFWIESGKPDRFGNTVWTVSESAYDFSFLSGEPIVVTVPEDCTVYANGKPLDDAHITKTEIHYDLFGDFYSDFDLPTKVTYTVEHYLGEIAVSAQDASGAEISLEDSQSWEDRLDNCPEDLQESISTFLNEFILRYVRFSGSSRDSARATYADLRKFLLPDSPLIQRFASAIDGLQYGQSIQDKIAEVQIHHVIQIDADNYFCDVTYLVDTMGKKGLVQTTNNLKVIITSLNGTLYISALTSY